MRAVLDFVGEIVARFEQIHPIIPGHMAFLTPDDSLRRIQNAAFLHGILDIVEIGGGKHVVPTIHDVTTPGVIGKQA